MKRWIITPDSSPNIDEIPISEEPNLYVDFSKKILDEKGKWDKATFFL
jgi:hypothetical protein